MEENLNIAVYQKFPRYCWNRRAFAVRCAYDPVGSYKPLTFKLTHLLFYMHLHFHTF